MAMVFPSSPNVDDTVTGPRGEVWLWDGVKWIAIAAAPGDFLRTIGGTMTGPIVLDGDPVEPLEAVPKEYVDRAVDDGVY